MATLADLLGSVNTGNMTGSGLNVAPVAYQRPRGFLDTLGKIGDALAAFGGNKPIYEQYINEQEKKYTDAVQKQQFQNVFRNFVENPNDRTALANLAQVNPEMALKVAPETKITPQGGVVRFAPLGSKVETLVAAPPKERGIKDVAAQRLLAGDYTPEQKPILENLAGMGPSGSDFQVVEGADGYYQVNKLTGERKPLGFAAPPRQGPAPPSLQAVQTADGVMVFDPRSGTLRPTGIRTAASVKVPGANANPAETGVLIKEAKGLLPSATSGGLQSAAAAVQGAVGIGTSAMAADERLNVIGARLVATVPRFEGPQSDKDTALYRQAAADVANPAKPRNVRLAALDTLEKLQQRAAGRRSSGKTIRFDAQGRRIP